MNKRIQKLKILCIVGARPNFVKIAPLIAEMKKYPNFIQPVLLHTGQHYDQAMSKELFRDLKIPKPDIYLYVGSGPHAKQTAEIMNRVDDVIIRERPNLILVVGDVNSTLACALVGAKLQIPVAHVEAGLRSFNSAMPEEINRTLTDRLSDLLFTTEQSANKNLLKEGLPKKKIFFVGNVMIDSLKRHLPRAKKSKIIKKLKLKSKKYILLTLHRAEIVDNKENLIKIFNILKLIGQKSLIVWPVHPRTKDRIREADLVNELKLLSNLIITDALGYLDFLSLEYNARAVLTDSGGVQEETTFLGVPCITLRQETERPSTVTMGTNAITGLNEQKIFKELNFILTNRFKKGKIPPLWDGAAAQRIVKVILKKYIKFFRFTRSFVKENHSVAYKK